MKSKLLLITFVLFNVTLYTMSQGDLIDQEVINIIKELTNVSVG